MNDQIANNIVHALTRIAHSLESLAKSSDPNYLTIAEEYQAKVAAKKQSEER